MKLVVVAVALLVVSVSADQCSPLERLKVKHQWFEAYGHGHARLILGLKLYNRFTSHLRLLLKLLVTAGQGRRS